jgi:hypothetical protein
MFDLIKVINKFEILFSALYLRTELWVADNDRIVEIERWLADSNNQVFWDYLSYTHETGEFLFWDKFDKSEMCRCIKITFSSWKTFIFSKGTKPGHSIKWIRNLDSYILELSPHIQKRISEIYIWLGELESKHFNSASYKKALEKIKARKNIAWTLEAN